MDKEKSWNEQLKESGKFLSEPFMEMFDENTFRIRRNLLIISSVVLTYKYSATGISPESSFLGIKLEGVDSESIDTILFIGVLYFLLHFVWSSLDKFSEWRLRLTGMPVAKPKHAMTFGGGYETGTHDQKQATLTSWWVANTQYYLEKDVYASHNVDFENVNQLKEIQTINLIKGRMEDLTKKGRHIELYLERYEKGFNNLQRSQRYRWLLIEFYLPIAIAIMALYLLIC